MRLADNPVRGLDRKLSSFSAGRNNSGFVTLPTNHAAPPLPSEGQSLELC